MIFPTLDIFDIDYTLFETFSDILVIEDQKVKRRLNSIEYNTYKLQPGESYDFSEFKSAEVFRTTSKPIPNIIRALKNILECLDTHEGNRVVVSTARSTFDDPAKFAATFTDYGIPLDKVEFSFAGDLHVQPTCLAKTVSFHYYLRKPTVPYVRAYLWDDSIDNLKGFMCLRKLYPETEFTAFHVTHKDGGSTSVFTP